MASRPLTQAWAAAGGIRINGRGRGRGAGKGELFAAGRCLTRHAYADRRNRYCTESYMIMNCPENWRLDNMNGRSLGWGPLESGTRDQKLTPAQERHGAGLEPQAFLVGVYFYWATLERGRKEKYPFFDPAPLGVEKSR